MMFAEPISLFEKGKLYDLPITDIRPDPEQPRKYIDPTGLAELAASIKQLGVLQPVLFREGEQGWVVLVAGERRFEAAKMAGLFVIPGIFVEGAAAEIALVENLQRQDLTAIEEAEALGRLVDGMQYTHEQAAGIIGKSRTTVTEILSLNNLPAEIRDDCRNNRKCPRQLLIEIARKKQERSMINLYNRYKESGLTAGEIHKARQPHQQKTELEIVETVLKSIVAAKTRIAGLEFASLEAETKTRLSEEITALGGEMEGRLSEIISLLRPVDMA
jgi:ParB family chromosome partitioning protein